MSTPSGHDHFFKITMVGCTYCGKSVLRLRFVESIYCEPALATGVEFGTRIIEIDGKEIKLQIWDTIGNERFRDMIASYYGRVQGIMLCFDLTKRNSFDGLKSRFIPDVKAYGQEGVVKILVGCKSDDYKSRTVTYEEAEALARELGISYVETSAKKDVNVDQAFYGLTKKILRSRQTLEGSENMTKAVKLRK